MLVIRGVNVYPTQVETSLLAFPDLTLNYRIVVSRSGTLDEAVVEVEVSQAFLGEAGTDSLSGELEHVRAAQPDRAGPSREHRLLVFGHLGGAGHPPALRRRQTPTRAG